MGRIDMHERDHRGATISVLMTESPSAVRLNIGNWREVEALCAAFGCVQTDVYVAVAMVGDKIRDVRAYLRKALGQDELTERGSVFVLESLPPAGPPAV
jgi:hypothetical protein